MKSHLELFRRLEREVRLSGEKLPIDAFLPAPDSLPTEFPDPPLSQAPVESRDLGGGYENEEQRREERRRLRRVRKAAPPPADAKPLKLEDEIQEFMNRDRKEGAKPEEIKDFLGGFDPSEIPEG
ncbi:MAG TPA: hypothetical protein VFW45_18090 [Candidatus Polarisedimenticolia bacterium]|nr:hypothetical protein [Candidatus Polarisedimenticolia bacterium]